ncbi:hypothetical protein GHT06_011791 [Daphnia sinensis]|uniref:N-acetyltransferase domain-containing protein n=1 Tax=Daphnia sinensis TaxID=1820382 RepID=A0AAD5LN28_9CRUS|nr:hypothetical protein GHT06_011791 [Daphnia sinensis]
MEKFCDLSVKVSLLDVRLADRSQLFQILPFLERHLPSSCETHSLVLSALLTSKASYGIYFLRNPNRLKKDDYSAIVGIKGEHRLDSCNQTQKVWILGGWSVNETALLRVYQAIDRIDWKCDIVLAYNRAHHPHPDFLRFFNDRQRMKMPFPLLDRYAIDVSMALEMEINLPDDVYVKSLEQCHAPLVFETWPYRHLTTLQDVSEEIVHLPSAGIFLKSNDKLVAWIMCHPPNGMSRLMTLEQYRRKGYASIVTKYLTKRVAQSGHLPYVNIVAGNSVSSKFFESLGFRYLGAGHVWVTSPRDPLRDNEIAVYNNSGLL